MAIKLSLSNKRKVKGTKRSGENFYKNRVLRELLQDEEWRREYAAVNFGVRLDSLALAEKQAIVKALSTNPDLQAALAQAYIESKLAEVRAKYPSVLEAKEEVDTKGVAGEGLGSLTEQFQELFTLVDMLRERMDGDEEKKSKGFSLPEWIWPMLMARFLGVPMGAPTSPPGYPPNYPPAGATQEIAQSPVPPAMGQAPAPAHLPSPPMSQGMGTNGQVAATAAPAQSENPASQKLPLLDPHFIWSLHDKQPEEAAFLLYDAIQAFAAKADPIAQAALDWFRMAVAEHSWQDVLSYLEGYRLDPTLGGAWGRIFDFLKGNPAWTDQFFTTLRTLWCGAQGEGEEGSENEGEDDGEASSN
jgi:hypothetical protein